MNELKDPEKKKQKQKQNKKTEEIYNSLITV